jgi:hypothetical protein
MSLSYHWLKVEAQLFQSFFSWPWLVQRNGQLFCGVGAENYGGGEYLFAVLPVDPPPQHCLWAPNCFIIFLISLHLSEDDFTKKHVL